MSSLTSGRILRLAIFSFTLLVGCTPPQYDSNTDKLITSLQSDTDTLLVNLISLDSQISALNTQIGSSPTSADTALINSLSVAKKSASYEENLPTYNKLLVDYTSLKTRIDAEPNKSTSNLDSALIIVDENLFGSTGLQGEHQVMDILDKVYLLNQQKTLDTQFSALLTYELVLKAGASTGSSKTSQGVSQ